VDQFRLNADCRNASQFRADDLPNLMKLYERENRARTGSQVRTPAYWAWLLAGLQASGRLTSEDIWLVWGKAGAAGGYAFFRPGFQGALEIWEAAAADEDAAASILRLALELARRQGSQSIDLRLPLDHPVARMALGAGAQLSGYSYGIFGRILNLAGLMDALAPELERRLRRSRCPDWEGTLLLETDAGELPLSIHGGTVTPGKTGGQGVRVRIPQGLLARLVSGYASVAWTAGALNMLRKTSRTSAPIPAEALPVLQALFPKGCPYMWNADIGY
jgi:hypothetical protein